MKPFSSRQFINVKLYNYDSTSFTRSREKDRFPRLNKELTIVSRVVNAGKPRFVSTTVIPSNRASRPFPNGGYLSNSKAVELRVTVAVFRLLVGGGNAAQRITAFMLSHLARRCQHTEEQRREDVVKKITAVMLGHKARLALRRHRVQVSIAT